MKSLYERIVKLSMPRIFSYVLVAMLIIISIKTVASMTGFIYGDEYIFVRLTENLPNSNTSADWLLIDQPKLANVDENGEEFYHLAYDTEVWVHPLLPNYLMYPLFKIIDPTMPNGARTIPLILMLASILLLVDIIRRRFNLTLACLSVLPFLLSNQLLGAGLWLYYDAFMIVFFVLSLWIIYTKPDSKWLYVTITAMLLSKETGLFFMLPLLIAYYHQTRNTKHTLALLLPIISIVLWVVYTGIVSGSILYIWEHWEALRPVPSLFNTDWTTSLVMSTLFDWGLLFYFVLTIPGFILAIITSIRTKNTMYLPFILYYVIPICCGFGWGFAPYHLHSMLYAGMIMVVFSVSIFDESILTINRDRWSLEEK